MCLIPENQKSSFCKENQELKNREKVEHPLKTVLSTEKGTAIDVGKRVVNAKLWTSATQALLVVAFLAVYLVDSLNTLLRQHQKDVLENSPWEASSM